MARKSLSFLLSALALFKDMTAQYEAGAQLMRVICKTRQMIAEIISPLKKNERKGTSIANNIFVLL